MSVRQRSVAAAWRRLRRTRRQRSRRLVAAGRAMATARARAPRRCCTTTAPPRSPTWATAPRRPRRRFPTTTTTCAGSCRSCVATPPSGRTRRRLWARRCWGCAANSRTASRRSCGCRGKCTSSRYAHFSSHSALAATTIAFCKSVFAKGVFFLLRVFLSHQLGIKINHSPRKQFLFTTAYLLREVKIGILGERTYAGSSGLRAHAVVPHLLRPAQLLTSFITTACFGSI